MTASRRAPVAVADIDHVVLRVRDPARMIRFYRQVLGLEVVRRRPALGLVHLRAGRAMLDLVDVAGPLGRAGGAAAGKGRRNMDHFALRLRAFDPQALAAHLARFGIAMGPPRPRFGARGEGPSVYISDPEGNVIELKGPANIK
jgi:glyoxylase I family protein